MTRPAVKPKVSVWPAAPYFSLAKTKCAGCRPGNRAAHISSTLRIRLFKGIARPVPVGDLGFPSVAIEFRRTFQARGGPSGSDREEVSPMPLERHPTANGKCHAKTKAGRTCD